MNKKITTLFWGLCLIGFGLVALAQSLGYIDLDNRPPLLWIIVFGCIGLFSLIVYFINGVRSWGLLFPAGIFSSLAVILALSASGMNNSAIGTPLFVGIGLPFVVAFLLDRQKNWWALIPTGVMAFLSFVLLMADNLAGEWIGSSVFVFLSIGFLLAYLGNRSRIWAACVAYGMFVLAFMPLMALTSRPEWAGVIFLTAVALPFLFVYFSSPARYWAVIPAGLLLSSGLVAAVTFSFNYNELNSYTNILNALALAGYAATFSVVWLRHGKNWARFLTIAAALLAVFALLTGNAPEIYGSILIIAIGFVLLGRGIRSGKLKETTSH